MNIKDKVDEVVKKVTSDKKIMEKFQKDPSATVKDIIGLDIPVEQVESIIAAVKAKLNLNSITNVVGGIFGKK